MLPLACSSLLRGVGFGVLVSLSLVSFSVTWRWRSRSMIQMRTAGPNENSEERRLPNHKVTEGTRSQKALSKCPETVPAWVE